MFVGTTPKSQFVANNKEVIILGIDPGTKVTGYGILKCIGNKNEVLQLGIIKLEKYTDPYIKLQKIYQKITVLIEEYHPDYMAIEAPFYSKNVQSMLKLGRAQGVAISAAIQKDVAVTEYAPMQIKKAVTGNGNADKTQVAEMLKQILKFEAKKGYYEDATDALGAAFCHSLSLGSKLLGAKSKKNDWSSFINNNPDRLA